MNVLKLGIPKGSLENNTVDLFKKAGWRIAYDSRSYFPDIDDPEISCTLVRAQEMSRYIEDGHLDLGLTGIDWIMENNSDVVAVQDLVYSKVSTRQARWVLVVRDDSPIRSIEDMEGKHISTELVNFTKKYFAEKNIKVMSNFPGVRRKRKSWKAWSMRLWKLRKPDRPSGPTNYGLSMS